MRYAIEEYDNSGYLSAPKWLWLGWLFLAKAWIVFIVAGASRDSGAELLAIVYPQHAIFYTGLVLGFPALVLLWLLGLRKPERKRVCHILSYGKVVTILVIMMQIGLVAYQIYLENINFSWVNATTLLGLVWLLIYIWRSRRVRDCFRSPLLK